MSWKHKNRSRKKKKMIKLKEKNQLKNKLPVGRSYGYRDRKVENKPQNKERTGFNIFK